MNTSAFKTKNWSMMTADERCAVLQEVEQSLAKEQGRAERKVVPKHYESDGYGVILGEFDPSNSKIYINEDLITGENEQLNNSCNQYNAVETVCHEGRHAYQHDTMGQNESFEHNLKEGYLDPRDKNITREEYRFQPIEADANDYADKIMAEYSKDLDDDPAFITYSYHRDFNNLQDESSATVLYGAKYKEVIQAKMETQYQNNQQSVLRYNESLETLPDLEQAQNASQEKGASEEASVERAR